MPVIEELLIGVGYKTDTKVLEAARTKARKAAADTEKAYKDAAKELEAAQDRAYTAVGKAAKREAQNAVRAAQKKVKASKDAAAAAKRSASETDAAFGKVNAKNTARAAKFSKAWKTAGVAVVGAFAGMTVAGVGALGALAVHTAAASKETEIWAKRIGVTAEELQALDIVAEGFNVEADAVREGVKTMRENLGELARLGTGPARDALGTFGIKLEEIADLKAEDQLKLISTAMDEVGDDGKNLSAIIELMGEDGAKLLPVLKAGAGEIGAMGDAARDSGRIMSDEMVATTIEVTKQVERMKGQVGAAGTKIASALLPKVVEIVDGISEWVDNNEEFLQQDLPRFFDGLAEAIRGVYYAFKDAINAAGQFGSEIGEKLSGKVIELQLAWSVATGEISLEAANAVRAGLNKTAVGSELADRPARRQPAAEAIPDFVGSAAGPSFDPGATTAATRGRRRSAFHRTELAKARGAGGSDADAELAAALAQVRLVGLEDDLRALGARAGASDKAIDKALKDAATQFKEGASHKVAREAGVGTLSKLTGKDLAAKETDPLLSALLGDGAAPDVPLSEATKDTTPQVLVSNVYNTFNVRVDNTFGGVSEPREAANLIEQSFRGLGPELSKVSKYSKVLLAR